MSTTGTSTKQNGSFPYGSSTGPLYDEFAINWFIRMAEIMETRVLGYIEAKGEPEDYHDAFHVSRKGNLGLEVGCHVKRKESGRLEYSFFLRADKYRYEEWAREHKYLMEGFITFRIGPVMVAHPGRPAKKMVIGGKERPSPINIWETEFGFLGKEGENSSWFNLLRETVIVAVTRNTQPDGPGSPAWLVERVH